LLDDPTRSRRTSPLTFVAAFGSAADRLVGVSVPSGAGIVGHVYRSGRSYATAVVERDPLFFGDVDALSAFRTRSLLATPVRLENAVCGVFELVNRKGRSTFSARDVELAELISQYVSRAILNAVDLVKQNELALRDDLTGLRNSRGMLEEIEREVRRAHRTGGDLAVMFLDVDRLKQLNDRLGHRAGSEALKRVGGAIATWSERGCVSYRFGGDEFIVVCPGMGLAGAAMLADGLREAVRDASRGPMRHGGTLPQVSASVGVASLRDSLRSAEARGGASRAARLLTAADRALYRAKRGGRDRTARASQGDDQLGR